MENENLTSAVSFTVVTEYDRAAYKALNRAARKTVLKKYWYVIYVLCAVLSVVALSELFSGNGGFTGVVVVVCVAAAVFFVLRADTRNAKRVEKRRMPGMDKITAVFSQEGYRTTGETASTEWKYEGIYLLVRMKEYDLLFIGKRHAHVIYRSGITEGSIEALEEFLEEKTGKKFKDVR